MEKMSYEHCIYESVDNARLYWVLFQKLMQDIINEVKR